MQTIFLKAGKEKAISRKHPWIFSGALMPGHEKIPDGTTVHVLNMQKKYLATGYYSPSSIAVRILEFDKTDINQNFFNRKINCAFQLRKQLNFIDNKQTNCFRLIHGEGDSLPGLIIDIYKHTAVVQCHTKGYLNYLNEIYKALIDVSNGVVTYVYFKSKDILTDKQDIADGFIGEKGEETIVVRENDSLFEINIVTGQKTGFFLDQRDNRELLKKYSEKKKILNTFSYSGGFSVSALMGGATFVTSVDASKKAVELCEKNIALNNFSNHKGIVADVLEFLKKPIDDIDIIILDPPAFAKHLSAKARALKGYRRINSEAIRKIKKNGIIFTFSCSQAIDRNTFESVIFASAVDANRNVRILHHLGQPSDHPVNIFHPEGHYLKGVVIHVE